MEIAFQRIHTQVQLRVAKDGIEAQQYMTGEGDYWDRWKHPLPDVILLDLLMPRLDGFEFLEWLRSRPDKWERGIPVVVMSCSTQPVKIARAYALGANGYLIKASSGNNCVIRSEDSSHFGKPLKTARIYST